MREKLVSVVVGVKQYILTSCTCMWAFVVVRARGFKTRDHVRMDLAERIAVVAAGSFFLAGLVLGGWKYVQITRSPDARAATYVDVAHRAALLYAFACLVVERFTALSKLGATVELVAVLAQIGFFALALASYVVHGLLRDTDNQLARPHRLGQRTIPSSAMLVFMIVLMTAEIGGFAVLFWGAFATS